MGRGTACNAVEGLTESVGPSTMLRMVMSRCTVPRTVQPFRGNGDLLIPIAFGDREERAPDHIGEANAPNTPNHG
jgi:hypothetical protein